METNPVMHHNVCYVLNWVKRKREKERNLAMQRNIVFDKGGVPPSNEHPSYIYAMITVCNNQDFDVMQENILCFANLYTGFKGMCTSNRHIYLGFSSFSEFLKFANVFRTSGCDLKMAESKF